MIIWYIDILMPKVFYTHFYYSISYTLHICIHQIPKAILSIEDDILEANINRCTLAVGNAFASKLHRFAAVSQDVFHVKALV